MLGFIWQIESTCSQFKASLHEGVWWSGLIAPYILSPPYLTVVNTQFHGPLALFLEDKLCGPLSRYRHDGLWHVSQGYQQNYCANLKHDSFFLTCIIIYLKFKPLRLASDANMLDIIQRDGRVASTFLGAPPPPPLQTDSETTKKIILVFDY
jgi:hypothetical protein